MIPEKLAAGVERLEFPFEFFDTDDSGDELDVLSSQEIFVLSLRVFYKETDGSGSWVNEGVSEWA